MKKLNYEALIAWTVIFTVIILSTIEIASHFTHPKTDWIYYKDVEVGLYDSIRDKKNLTRIGDTLVIRHHSIGSGQSKIWGKYEGYLPQGGPTQIKDTTYYVYFNKVIRLK